MKIKELFSTKKRIAAVVASLAVLAGGAGIAAAVFTATGSGVGAATVGKVPAGLTVMGTRITPASATLTPPATAGISPSTLILVYKVTNNTSTGQTITTTKASATFTHNASSFITTYTNTDTVTGCYFTWFDVTSVTFDASYLAAGTSTTAFVTVSMPYSATTQDACSGARPEVTLTVPSHA